MGEGIFRVKIRNSRDRWVFVGVVTGLSLLGSLVLTWVLSPVGLRNPALLPAIGVPLLVAPMASSWSAQKMLRLYQLRLELERVLNHDSLTGLLNRKAYFDLFEPDNGLGRGGIFLVCVDGFKDLNRSYGHKIADHVIAMVARVLKAHAAAGGYVARIGNARFVLFLPNEARGDQITWAERIRSEVEQARLPADLGGLSCTVSIGVEFREADENIDATMRRADHALEDAQAGGGNHVRQFQFIPLP